MFCYTIANSIYCIIRELLIWSRISGQHPVFLINVARLTNKRLGKKVVSELNRAEEEFDKIHSCVKEMLGKLESSCHMITQDMAELIKCMKEFLAADNAFIETLLELKEYGKKDRLWQTLVEHIEQEQRYMYRLIETLLMQVPWQT